MKGQAVLRKAIRLATRSLRTRHTELLRLCARIGYSPPEA